MKKLLILSFLGIANLAYADYNRTMFDYLTTPTNKAADWRLSRLEKMPNLNQASKTMVTNAVIYETKGKNTNGVMFAFDDNKTVNTVYFDFAVPHWKSGEVKGYLAKLVDTRHLIKLPIEYCSHEHIPEVQYQQYKWQKKGYKPLYLSTRFEYNNGGVIGSFIVADNQVGTCPFRDND